MPTECIAESFDFGIVEGRPVEAAFDGGLVTSDAGALLLGVTDRAIGMVDRFAACFHDVRRPEWIEHTVATLVGQRVFRAFSASSCFSRRTSSAWNAPNRLRHV